MSTREINLLQTIITNSPLTDEEERYCLRKLEIDPSRAHTEALRVLHQPRIVQAYRKSRGETPLHTAVALGNIEVVFQLLKAGADPNAKDSCDRIPLHTVACQLCSTITVTSDSAMKIVTMLLENGANRDALNRAGQTPLYTAASASRPEVIYALLEAGADPHAKDNFNNTPFSIAKTTSMEWVFVKHAFKKTPLSSLPGIHQEIISYMYGPIPKTAISSADKKEQEWIWHS